MLYNLLIKAIGILAILSGGLYLDWTVHSLDWDIPLLAGMTYVFTVFSFLLTLILVLNNWHPQKKNKQIPLLDRKFLPNVAIIIPIWNEPIYLIERTILSVISASYPLSKILIIVTDDGRNIELKTLIHYLRNKYQANIVYNLPPQKNSTKRNGEGKAGNLNSAFELIKNFNFIRYIETRDVDDMVGDRDFLIKAISELENDNKLAYIQTIKESLTSKGDPFSNRERFFYNNVIPGKDTVNAVFPCGSGLVWRKEALVDINGFSAWNLVEDVQSGLDALKKGWKGKYLPIIGAIGQIAPEDLQNVIKQRTTWAIDSFRMFLWQSIDELSFKQRFQFLDAPLTYLFSIFMLLQTGVISIVLLTGEIPIKGDNFVYGLHVIVSILTNFLFISALRRNTNVKMKEVVKSVMLFLGLGPQFLISLIKVLLYGKNKKPRYIVTRKENKNNVYLHLVIPQILLIDFILFSIIKNIQSSGIYFDWINILWGVMYILMYFRIVKLSWYKYNIFKDIFYIEDKELQTQKI